MNGMNVNCFNNTRLSHLLLAATLPLLLATLALGGCGRKTPEEQLREAHELYSNRDILGAQLKYEKILEGNPEGQIANEARMGLAMTYMADGDYEKSREQLDKVIAEIGVTNPQGLQIMALKLNTWVREKKPEKALEEALATSPTLHGAPDTIRQQFQLMLSEVYLANNNEAEAMKISERIVNEWPDNAELHIAAIERMVQLQVQQKKLDKAIEIYQNYLKNHPGSPIKAQVLFGIAFYQKELGQTDKANETFDASEQSLRQELEKAMGADAKADVLIRLGKVQMARENVEAARETLNRLIKEFPTTEAHNYARFMLADIALQENKPQDAIAILSEVIKENPESRWATGAGQRIQQIQAQALRPTTGTQAMNLGTTGSLPVTTGTQALTLPTTGTLPAATTGTQEQPPATPAAPAAATTTSTTTEAPAQ